MKEKYYSIKVIGLSSRGYVTPSKKGIILSENHADICYKFQTIKEANDFIRANKLQKAGFRAYVRSSEEIELEISRNKALHGENKKGAFKIVNEKGLIAHYSVTKKQYFFSTEEKGCASWHDKPSVKEFVQKIQGYFPQMKIKARKLR